MFFVVYFVLYTFKILQSQPAFSQPINCRVERLNLCEVELYVWEVCILMNVPTVSMSRILNAPKTPRCSDSNDFNVLKIRTN